MPMASGGCVVGRSLESFVLCQVLSGRCQKVGVLEAGRRQEVTSKSQASFVEPSPLGIHTSAASRLARCGSPVRQSLGWRRPAFSVGGSPRLGPLRGRHRPPRCGDDCGLHGHTAVVLPKRSTTWPHREHCVSVVRKGMPTRCCRDVRTRSASQSKEVEAGPGPCRQLGYGPLGWRTGLTKCSGCGTPPGCHAAFLAMVA